MDNKQGTAGALINTALDTMAQRGKQYDGNDKGLERSMGRIVTAYNAITDQAMTEAQGHAFMTVLKMVRAELSRDYDADHYVDGVNYMAMYGEAKHAAEVAKHIKRCDPIDLTGEGLTAATPTHATTWNGGHMTVPRHPLAEGLAGSANIQMQQTPPPLPGSAPLTVEERQHVRTTTGYE